jgi:hypothetical protein
VERRFASPLRRSRRGASAAQRLNRSAASLLADIGRVWGSPYRSEALRGVDGLEQFSQELRSEGIAAGAKPGVVVRGGGHDVGGGSLLKRGRVRASACPSAILSLPKVCSMGEKSGEQRGQVRFLPPTRFNELMDHQVLVHAQVVSDHDLRGSQRGHRDAPRNTPRCSPTLIASSHRCGAPHPPRDGRKVLDHSVTSGSDWSRSHRP